MVSFMNPIGISPVSIALPNRRNSSAPPIVIEPTAPINTGKPMISGEPREGVTLVATRGVWSTGGVGISSYEYQWLREGEPIQDATSETYTLTADDNYNALSVEVIARNALGLGIAESDPTGRVAPAPHAPVNTELPTITGIARSQEVLAANSNGQWTGNGDELLDFNYQWLTDGVAMPGKTGTTILLTDNEVGKRISLRVTAINSVGATVVESLQTAAVIAAQFQPAIVSRPTITGVARSSYTLTVSTGTWNNGGSPIHTYTYQWFADDVAIAGATTNTFTITDAELGKRIRAEVTAINAVGSITATTVPTAVVAEAVLPPSVITAPRITGTARQYETLTVSDGEWNANDGTISGYTYEWKRSGVVIPGETGNTYTLTADDVGKRIQAFVTATNEAGSTTRATSQTSTVTLPLKPVAITKPVVSGTVAVGEVLTTTDGVWNDNGNPITAIIYQWRAGSTNIAGATNNTYTVQSSDIGKRLSATVTAINEGGGTSSITDQTIIVPVPPEAPTVITNPVITGLAKGGVLLTASTGTWNVNGSPITEYLFQWYAGGLEIAGATAANFTPDDNHAGSVITVGVRAINALGTSEEARSAGTAPVRPTVEPPTNRTLPFITPTNASPDSLLDADSGNWDGNGEDPVFSYQWWKDGVEIPGASAITHQLTEDDIGAFFHVVVTATNSAGSKSANSSQIGPVTSSISSNLVLDYRVYDLAGMPKVNVSLPLDYEILAV
ncbi:hypothetical protein KEU06_09690 [Pseudaminobacter sp. 19-2017]|uniref:Fibronectin type-III domain-containing protein n=1 Tax=Pseudaminobacter soli (ex Zhang et al. 2022) TaxID=2831468 RepID=A0A942E0G1_9HYPH|nr:hypothetical protein [Pseudaminobacter soli]MBS3648878.1 hypothetical protein [Pseudaminobacter soli]